MEIAKLIESNIEVAALRLSENMILIKHLEKKHPDRVIITNNAFGKKLGCWDRRWNFSFEGKIHWVAMSILASEFEIAAKKILGEII